MDINITITILIFVGVLLFAVGIFYYLRSADERSNFMNRIEKFGVMPVSAENSATGAVKVKSKQDQQKERVANIVGAVGSKVKPGREEEVSRMRELLSSAGYRKPNSAIVFYGVKFLCLFIFLLTVFLALRYGISKPLSMVHFIGGLLFAALIGSYLPNMWLRKKIAKRKRNIVEALPDTLDLLIVCVESGMGFDAAMHRVSREMASTHKVISDEFKTLNMEVRAGRPRRNALKNLVKRNGVEELNDFVTLLIQTDIFGTSVAQALRVHSDSMRVERRQRAEETAAKLPVKLMIPMILFIFPTIFVVIIGPAIIQLMRNLLPAMSGK